MSKENNIVATFNAYNQEDLLIYANAKKMFYLLWDLQHNFHRQFKYVEVSHEDVLKRLFDELSVINTDYFN